MKTTSLSTRLYRTIFMVSCLTVSLTLVAFEWMFEDIEDSILGVEFDAEREYFHQKITEPDFQQWRTARLRVIFLGSGQPQDLLPEIARNLPVGFSAEVEQGEGDYLVSVESISEPPGTLYLIQDISALEDREFLGQIAFLAVTLLILMATFVLSRVGAQKLTEQLKKLTREILHTSPGKDMPRLTTGYSETEYVDIANAFNRFLDEMERFVEREKIFVNLASHELRTPLAIISGALDVIEKRQQLTPQDRNTLARIRRAAADMQADVDILLKLARGRSDGDLASSAELPDILNHTVTDLIRENPAWEQRLEIQAPESGPSLRADPALIRILFRNLVQNGLKHTQGRVRVEVTGTGIRISDYGDGLPELAREKLFAPINTVSRRTVESGGFGLFIIRLVCERLGWRLTVFPAEPSGTVMTVAFHEASENSRLE